MKATTYVGPKQIEIKEVDKPALKDPRDAILRVTSAAICGSDLHMYDGRTIVKPGTVLGHEIMGVIEEVGDSVTQIKAGDRVVLPFNIACGMCLNCVRGFTNACLYVNDEHPGAAYGYASMGPYGGGQAEYVRVPFADFNALKVPGKPHDELENDFLMLADIFPTGFHACQLAQVSPGKTVAIYGAGPVGLLAAHSAMLIGASQVFIVDQSEERLKIAKEFGAIPINFRDGKPSDQIKEMRRRNPLIMEAMRPGEEKNAGVMCGIDAVGYQARNFDDSEEKPTEIFEDLVEVVNFGGAIGVIGVFMPEDPGGPNENAKQGKYTLPYGKFWNKGLSLGTGQCPVKKYDWMLRDLIIAGRAKPGKIVSQEPDLNSVTENYQKFDNRGMGEGKEYTKVVLKPNKE